MAVNNDYVLGDDGFFGWVFHDFDCADRDISV
jgi:hypothetical protein